MWQYRLQVAFNKLDNAIPRVVKCVAKQVAAGGLAWLYRTLTRATPDRFLEVIVQDGPLRGRRYVCNLKYERDLFLGKHEPEVVEAFRRLVRPGDTVVDIGGHSGYFALVLADYVGSDGRVISFEPGAANVARFRTNLALNPDLARRISLRVAAVMECAGEVSFSAGPFSFTGHVVETPEVDAVLIRSVSLDDVVAAEKLRPALIKMDIEGGEIRALPGMLRTLRHHRPALIVEVHAEDAHRCFLDVLAAARYEARPVGRDTWNAAPTWTERVQYEARPVSSARHSSNSHPEG